MRLYFKSYARYFRDSDKEQIKNLGAFNGRLLNNLVEVAIIAFLIF